MSIYNPLMNVVFQKKEGPVKHYNIVVGNEVIGNVAIFKEARKEDGQILEYIERLSVDTNLADYDQVKDFIENYVMESN